jgi:hypothetical protein
MDTDAATTNPGWYVDPTGRHQYRYWDGVVWSDAVADEGVTGQDAATFSPPEAPVAAAPGAVATQHRPPAPVRAAPAPPPPPPPPAPAPAPSPVAAPASPVATAPLRECRLARPVAVVGAWSATAAAAFLLAMGTFQFVLLVTIGGWSTSTTTRSVPLDGGVFWGTRGDLNTFFEVYVMGPLFLILLVARMIVAQTSFVKPPRVKRTSFFGLWKAEPAVPRPTYLFKSKGLTARLVIVTTLSAAMTLFYVLLTASISGDGYEIRAFGWIGLVLMVSMLVGDIAALTCPRPERVWVDRLKNVSLDTAPLVPESAAYN